MDYALALLALLAAVVGIAGNTWKSGRPTPIGWVAGSVALVAFLVTVTQHYKRHREEEKIAELACVQVLRGTFGLVTPFAILLADVDLREKEPGTGPTPLNNRIEAYLRLNEDALSERGAAIFADLPALLEHTSLLDTYEINDHTMVLNRDRGPRWSELFATTAMKGIDELDATLAVYRSVMSSAEVAAAQRLRNAWLTQRIENLQHWEGDPSLGDFLRLDERTKEGQPIIFREFLRAAEDTHKLCARASGP